MTSQKNAIDALKHTHIHEYEADSNTRQTFTDSVAMNTIEPTKATSKGQKIELISESVT